jgi:hypothetical protein
VANKDITPQIKARAIERASQGDSLILIAEEIGVPPFTVYTWLPKNGDWTNQKDELVQAGRDLLKAGYARFKACQKLGFSEFDRFREWVLDSLPGLETLSPEQK